MTTERKIIPGSDVRKPVLPEEAEVLLNAHPLVQEAVVSCRTDVRGRARVVAYVVPVPEQTIDTLRARLDQDLVAAPDDFVFLAALPTTRDGAVDLESLHALPVIDAAFIAGWTQALASQAGISAVEVVPAHPIRRFGVKHRLDLYPGLDQPQTPAPRKSGEAVTSGTHGAGAQPATSAVAQAPAIAHGFPLNLPDDHPATLGDALRRAAARYPGHGITYVGEEGSETFQSYPQLLADAERCLGALTGLGVRPGDKVIFQLRDPREFLVAFWGCVIGGVVPVPVTVPADYAPGNAIVQKIVSAWRLLDKPLILTSGVLAPGLAGIFRLMDIGDARVLPFSDMPVDAVVPANFVATDDLCLLLLTSGSTGQPKAVMHSHRTLLSEAVGTIAHIGFGSEDVSMNWIPLDHVGAICFFHLRSVMTGCTQVIAQTQWILEQPIRWLDVMSRHRATDTWAPNFAYALVAEQADEIARQHWDLSSLRVMLSAGEAVVARTTRRFLRLMQVHGLAETAAHPAWGMSETASGLTYSSGFSLSASSDEDTTVEIGGPIPGTSLRIVDGDNRLLAEGEMGNLQVRGAGVMPGYYQNPEENRKAFTADGWFVTGDVGFVSGGKLTVTARAKDEIIINGVNYPAAEIEAIVDAVKDVEVSFSAACAVRSADGDTEELAIFFSPAPSATGRLAEVLRSISAEVASKFGIRPACLVPLARDRIPKTSIGKIQRSQLKQRLEAGELAAILKDVDVLTGTHVIPDWFYRKVWRAKAVHRRRPLKDLGLCVVFADASGLGNAVCARLQQAGLSCVIVEAGAEFAGPEADCYRIDPACAEHYGQLLRSIRERHGVIGQILHCFAYDDRREAIGSMQELAAAQSCGIYSVLHLVQALARTQGDSHAVGLTMAACRTQMTSAEDTANCLHAAAVGLLKTVQMELDWIRCRHVDLDAGPVGEHAGFILDELQSPVDEDEVAYRDGRRLVWGLAPAGFTQAADAPAPIRRGGLYLITGGLGRVGSFLAGELIGRHGARLILTGRTALPDPGEWPACQAQGGRTGERVRQYLELQSLGGDIVYEAADVADTGRLREIVAAAESRWNERLAGVFHLAVGGEIASQWQDMERHSVLGQTTDAFEQMFRAKVYGAWALYQLVRGRPEAFIVPFSSVIGLYGAANLVTYAAAHTFMNNYSLAQHHQGLRSYLFEWAEWSEHDADIDAQTFAEEDFHYATGFCPIPKQIARDCLIAGLWQAQPELIVGLDGGKLNVLWHVVDGPQPLRELAAFCVADGGVNEHPSLDALEVRDAFGVPGRCAVIWLPALPVCQDGQVDREALLAIRSGTGAAGRREDTPQTEAQKRIAAIWRDVLGMPRFGIHDNFFQLGGNSLAATRLVSQMRQTFRVSLDTRDLLERATILGLAELVDERQAQPQSAPPQQARNDVDAEVMLERLEEMSDSEVAKLLAQLQGEGAGS